MHAYGISSFVIPLCIILPQMSGFSLRVCLIPITIAGERLRRSPDLVCGVEQALSACSTPHTKSICAALPREHTAREGEVSEHQTRSKGEVGHNGRGDDTACFYLAVAVHL